MRSGRVMARKDFVVSLSNRGMTDEQVRDWEQDQRGDHTLQVCLLCDDHSRTLWISFHDLTLYRTMDKDQSTLMARGWAGLLMNQIDFGQPGTSPDANGI